MSTRARASRIALPFRFTVYETVTSGGPSAYLTFEHLRGGEAPSRYSIYLDDQGLKSLIETLCDYSVQAQRDKEIA